MQFAYLGFTSTKVITMLNSLSGSKARNGFLLVAGCLLLATGCAGVHSLRDAAPGSSGDSASKTRKVSDSPARASEVLRTTIDAVEEDVDGELGIQSSDEEPSLADVIAGASSPSVKEEAGSLAISLTLNDGVKKWIEYFSRRDHARFQRFLDRGYRYKGVVETVLEENDLPSELYYLAMIESGYVTHARSHAKAVGAWQFIEETGRRYGLESNAYVDERRDPVRATEAAAKYLKDLYNAFQSWELALAGYNCGEFRVLRTIMSSKTRDFWKMRELRRLPRETRNYVPKFVAAAIIGRNPEKYGFVDPAHKNLDSYPSIESVEVPSPVKLTDVSRLTGIPLGELKAVNPHLLRGLTPPGVKTYDIWVQSHRVSAVQSIESKLARLRAARRTRIAGASNPHFHVVRRGENLSTIGKRYRLSALYLKRINGLTSDRIHPGTRLRTSAGSYSRSSGKAYRVRRGDTLGRIARRFGTTIPHLRRANSLRGSRILVGQRLTIPGSVLRHRVRAGDSLLKLSRRYNVPIHRIKKVNKLRSNTIYVGQWIRVPTRGT